MKKSLFENVRLYEAHYTAIQLKNYGTDRTSLLGNGALPSDDKN